MDWKSIYSLIFIALLSSCQMEIEEGASAPEFRAEFESEPTTKTSLSVDESGAGTIYWTPSDQIDVFFGSTRAHYTSQNTEIAASTIFKTNDAIGSPEIFSTNIWGLYPSYSSSTCDGSSVTTVLPSVQYGVPETFDDDLFVSVAHTSNSSLQFYNVCGGIKFSLSRDDITSVSFRGNDGEDLAGEISVTFVNGLPKATVLNGVKEVTLTPKTGQTFAKDVNYYLIVLPGILSKGFTMTFTTADGLVGVLDYSEKAITIKRSIFSRKAKIDSYAKFDDEPSNKILYTSTDGKIITPYASAVFGANIISNEYVNGQGVITFDGSVKRIGTYAFYGCSSLTSVSIPSSVSSIGAYAFNRCISLTSIIIPSSVTSIDPTAFYRCGSLSSIIVDSNNRYYDSRNSCNAIIQTETNELIRGCKNSNIPSSVSGIGAYAFDGCSSLTSISIPTSVTSIGYSAFRECSSLTSIIIPSSVSSIGACLFIGCDSLSSIIVDSNNRYYDSRNSCNAIIQTETNELISGCKNSVIPSSVTSIGDSAFMECSNLKSVTIPTSVTRIGSSTFRGCSSLTSIIIPSSVTSIGDSAFKECDSLTSITISSSVTGIGPYAFENCISLKSIIIPSSVTFIGTQAFYHCNALSYITILAVSPPGSGPEMFHYTNNCPIYVPARYVEAYKTAVYWSSYADRIQAVSTNHVPDAIDLGLPSGLKWASFNVGASKPEEYGDYFAWGETATKTNYSWSTYKWCNGTSNTLTKYNSIASNGTIDNKFLLEETDDVANVKLGGKWRMPTDAEWKELQDNCSWIWTTKNSIRGRLVTSNKNGASIFLPAAGYWFVTDLNDVGSTGLYWSSSLDYTNYPDAACFLLFDSGNVNRDINARYLGFSVRPVYGDATISVTGISLNISSLSMTIGDTQTLTATVTPSNATDKSVTWSSSNTSVAMVSSSGVVTAKTAGTATITVKTNDGSKTATCAVTVKAKTVSVTGVSLNYTSLSMTEGETRTLTATVAPSNATDKSMTWSSSNTSVATVSSSGVVTAKAAGSATIAVTTNDGGKKATCSVTIQAQTVSVTGVNLDYSSLSMKEGDTQTLTATVTPSNATDKSVTWSSSNTSVATVSASGIVTAKEAGSATITVTTNDGRKKATCSVTVKEQTVPVTGVSLDKTSMTMTVGDTQTLTATITPSNATNKSVSWSSSNTSVATVSSSGVVTAKAAGSATITVTTNDGDKKTTCSVVVTQSDYEAIDLGLSVKWASCNVGASKPEDYGDYFAWGETEPKDVYSWATYKWLNGINLNNFIKYCPVDKTTRWGGSGTPDGKTVLDPEDDAAHVNLGGNWRMPTDAEWEELEKNCTWTLTTLNGVRGMLFTASNGNSIFLPAAGYRDNTSLTNIKSHGYYWSSNLNIGNPTYAWYGYFYSAGSVGRLNGGYRERGYSVRPVSE